MNSAAPAIRLNGALLLPEPEGALWWAERHTLLVADLHLEKGSAFARRGRPLPPYDSAATLARLAALLRRLPAERVVCLGDSFHDAEAAARLGTAELAGLRGLMAGRDWVWIAGNHDPAPPAELGGRAADRLTLGPLTFRHIPSGPGVAGEVAGHLHPKATVATRGRTVRAACFVTDGRRLILPALGAYAGGLDVHDPAIAALFRRGFRVLLLGRERLHAFPAGALARSTGC